MSIVDSVRNLFRPKPTPPVRAVAPAPPSPRAGGGRASIDTAATFPTSSWLIVPPNSYEENWQLLTIDSKAFERISPIRLMEILADLSPEVSRALWDFLRLCNPGWTVKAFKLTGKGDTVDKRAQAAVDEFIRVLEVERKKGSFDTVIGEIYTGAFLRGAFCAELVLDENGRLPLDMAVPDPASVRFRRKSDPVLGSVWEPGQWQYGSQFVSLNIPTFYYLPVDKMPGSPYGRPMAAPALFTSLFLLGMLHDLKRVIQQQGYPRLDVAVDMAALLAMAPQLGSNQEAFQAFADQLIASVETAYRNLKPDDAYIHTSNISVNKPVGAADAGSLGGIDAVIGMLERMAVRALKTMPLMMGIADHVGDVQANRQYEVFNSGIKSIQHYCETMLERLFTLALEVQGMQAKIEFVFAELRASEELRDAQSEQLQILNEKAKVDNGWQTNDEAAETVVGHPAVAPPVVRQPPQQAPGIGNVDGQPAAQQNNATPFTNGRVKEMVNGSH